MKSYTEQIREWADKISGVLEEAKSDTMFTPYRKILNKHQFQRQMRGDRFVYRHMKYGNVWFDEHGWHQSNFNGSLDGDSPESLEQFIAAFDNQPKYRELGDGVSQWPDGRYYVEIDGDEVLLAAHSDEEAKREAEILRRE